MIYIDTSAMVKLIAAEPESGQLIEWLNTHADESIASSGIGHIELIRATRRLGEVAAAAGQRLASTIDTLVLTDSIAAVAGTILPPELRTLDAIHLGTALMHRDRLFAFCAYDRRLLDAAASQGLPAVAPGT
ncbi:MAG: PilT protein domain protein [Mycobacterium sp.]|jgi:predicted nucleic acid-binding protein|nr:PilT protein domain protein [Mycobacterium sp.]